MRLLLHDSSRKGTLYSTPLYSSCLSQLRTGPSWATWSPGHAICEDSGSAVWKDHDVGQQKRTMSCSRVGREGGFRGSSTCPLAADGGEKCRIIYICISFLRAVVVVLVVSVIILIHFVVVIFSLRMYAQQVFSALFTGVFNTIACVCRRGVSGGFPAGLRLVFVRDSLDYGSVSPFLTGG